MSSARYRYECLAIAQLFVNHGHPRVRSSQRLLWLNPHYVFQPHSKNSELTMTFSSRTSREASLRVRKTVANLVSYQSCAQLVSRLRPIQNNSLQNRPIPFYSLRKFVKNHCQKPCPLHPHRPIPFFKFGFFKLCYCIIRNYFNVFFQK